MSHGSTRNGAVQPGLAIWVVATSRHWPSRCTSSRTVRGSFSSSGYSCAVSLRSPGEPCTGRNRSPGPWRLAGFPASPAEPCRRGWLFDLLACSAAAAIVKQTAASSRQMETFARTTTSDAKHALSFPAVRFKPWDAALFSGHGMGNTPGLVFRVIGKCLGESRGLAGFAVPARERGAKPRRQATKLPSSAPRRHCATAMGWPLSADVADWLENLADERAKLTTLPGTGGGYVERHSAVPWPLAGTVLRSRRRPSGPPLSVTVSTCWPRSAGRRCAIFTVTRLAGATVGAQRPCRDPRGTGRASCRAVRSIQRGEDFADAIVRAAHARVVMRQFLAPRPDRRTGSRDRHLVGLEDMRRHVLVGVSTTHSVSG